MFFLFEVSSTKQDNDIQWSWFPLSTAVFSGEVKEICLKPRKKQCWQFKIKKENKDHRSDPTIASKMMGSPEFQKISCRGLMETYPWIRVLYNHQQHPQTIKWNSEASLRKMKLPWTYVILVFHGWVFMLQVVYKWFLGLITRLGLLPSGNLT